jgi:hypothetical protein
MRLVGTPVIEDEQVYLFQARSLAAGHLTYPSPPRPEFFETAHILVVPRFAAKYLPGHALLIAPFVALGVPRLEPCLMLGVTAALLFIAGRLLGLRRWSALLAGALFLGSTDAVADLASFRSQSTSVAAVAAAFVAMLLVRSDPRPARVVALFGLAMFAGFVRPFTGLALLLGAAAIVPRSRAAWALLPLLAGAAIAAVIFHATTGSWTTPPWALYARQYMPFDGPGIGAVHAPAPERGFPPHLRSLYDAADSGGSTSASGDGSRPAAEPGRAAVCAGRTVLGADVAALAVRAGVLRAPADLSRRDQRLLPGAGAVAGAGGGGGRAAGRSRCARSAAAADRRGMRAAGSGRALGWGWNRHRAAAAAGPQEPVAVCAVGAGLRAAARDRGTGTPT